MSPIIRKGLENFQSFVEVFVGGIILDDLEEEGPEHTQAIPLKTKPQGQQSCWDPWSPGLSEQLDEVQEVQQAPKLPTLGPFSFPQELAMRDKLGVSEQLRVGNQTHWSSADQHV